MIKPHCPAPADDIKLLLCGPQPMIKMLISAITELGYVRPRAVSRMDDQTFSSSPSISVQGGQMPTHFSFWTNVSFETVVLIKQKENAISSRSSPCSGSYGGSELG
ncbi:hypothetical protein G6F68_018700 [Rhizopus microsporus]|nr:hypothetical protein G6F68_018700 [Rhizopus microsporus]